MTRHLLALAALSLVPLAASAHGMSVDVRVSGGTVAVSVFYDDDSPAVGAKVKVYDAAKAVVLEGTTDDKGAWAFPAPPPGEYTVRAKTEDGHAARESFTVSADPPPAEAPVVETPSLRPPRLLSLTAGVVGIVAVFGLLYVVARRKRSAPPAE